MEITITLEQAWVGQSKKSNQEKKPYSVSSRKMFIDKYLRTSYLVGHLILEKLYINDLFDRKHIIEYLEA